MPRYVKHGCCLEEDHITNRLNPDYYLKMKQDLSTCCGAVKDFLFTSGNRHGRLLDPARNLSGLAVTEIWGADPVHPKKEVYVRLADGAVEVEKSCGGGPPRVREAVSSSPSPHQGAGYRGGSSRGRGDLRKRGGSNWGRVKLAYGARGAGRSRRGGGSGGGGGWSSNYPAGQRKNRWGNPY